MFISNMLILKQQFDSSCSTVEMQNLVGIAGFVLKAIQWIVPILLILWGTIDLVKSVVAGKEDDVKKNQKVLVKRVISAVIVFLIPMLVSIIMGLIGTEEWKTCWDKYHKNGFDKLTD